MVSFFIIKFLWGVALRVFFCCCLDHNLLGNKRKKIDEKIKKIKALKKNTTTKISYSREISGFAGAQPSISLSF